MRVYLITNHQGKYKIGYTGRTTYERLLELQTASPEPLAAVSDYETDLAPKIEQVLHRQLAQYRTQGEWFALPKDVVDGFKQRAQQVEQGLKVLLSMGNEFI